MTVAHGVQKRPPFEIVRIIKGVTSTEPFWYWFRGPKGEWYLFYLFNKDNFDVYRLSDGAKLNLTQPNGLVSGYLDTYGDDGLLDNTLNPMDHFQCVSVGDRTFIMNKTVTVEASADLTAGSLSGTAQTLQDTALDNASGIWKILGDDVNQFDTYYAKNVSGKWVEWVEPGIPESLDASTMPLELKLIYDAVDPFGVRFELVQPEWEKRLVGDTKSNKFPSFTGGKMNDIFFSHDRLGFLSANNVCMSETGEYTNFFRTEVVQVLDTDRIDVTITGEGNTHLYHAKPLQKQIIVFGDNAEWAVDGEPILSPRSVTATLTTAYNADTFCPPTNAGPNLFYASRAGEHTHIREMFVQEDTLTNDAANVTAHAPEYIPKNARFLEAHNSFDMLFVLPFGTTDEGDEIYVYQYYWSADEKVQSAWHRWTMPAGITLHSIKVVGDYLYAVVKASNTGVGSYFFLAKMNLKVNEPGLSVGSQVGSHHIHLDFIQEVEGVFDVPSGYTEYVTTLPVWTENYKPYLRMVGKEAAGPGIGRIDKKDAPLLWQELSDGSHYGFRIYGDVAGAVWIGFQYDQEITFSEQFWRESNGQPTLNARLQMRNMTVSFTDTGYFRTEVTVKGHDPESNDVVPGVTDQYTARTVGDEYFTLNNPQLATGTYRFPVFGKSSEVTIKLINDGYTPCNIQTAEWEGLVTTRTKR